MYDSPDRLVRFGSVWPDCTFSVFSGSLLIFLLGTPFKLVFLIDMMMVKSFELFCVCDTGSVKLHPFIPVLMISTECEDYSGMRKFRLFLLT